MKWLFKWIIDDIKRALAALKRGETWLVIGMITGFSLLGWLVLQFALKTDSVLRHLHYSASACREMSNGPIIFLFCGMMFFLFATVITFGEIQRYFHFKERGAHYETRQSMRNGIIALLCALAIALGALIFFNTYCR